MREDGPVLEHLLKNLIQVSIAWPESSPDLKLAPLLPKVQSILRQLMN